MGREKWRGRERKGKGDRKVEGGREEEGDGEREEAEERERKRKRYPFHKLKGKHGAGASSPHVECHRPSYSIQSNIASFVLSVFCCSSSYNRIEIKSIRNQMKAVLSAISHLRS